VNGPPPLVGNVNNIPANTSTIIPDELPVLQNNNESATFVASSNNDPGAQQVINTVQIAMGDGTLQSFHISNVDLGGLQLDENLFSNLGNVILMGSSNQVGGVLGLTSVQDVNIIDSNCLPDNSQNIGGFNSGTSACKDFNSDVMTTYVQSAVEHTTVSSHQQLTSIPFAELNGIGSLTEDNVINSNIIHTGTGGTSDTIYSMGSIISSNSADSNIREYFLNQNGNVEAVQKVNNVTKGSTLVIGKKSLPTSNDRQCSECGKIFSKPSQLSRHLRTHNGERPYKCGVCSSSFSQLSSLEAHRFTHTNEKPFVCPLCTFQTVQKSALKKHCGRAHPNIPWEEILAACGSTKTSSGCNNEPVKNTKKGKPGGTNRKKKSN